MRVPLNTHARLTLPGTLSTAGHWDQMRFATLFQHLLLREPLDQSIIHTMLTNPKPDIPVRKFDSQRTILQCHSRGPNLLPIAIAQFLEVQRRMLRIRFQ